VGGKMNYEFDEMKGESDELSVKLSLDLQSQELLLPYAEK